MGQGEQTDLRGLIDDKRGGDLAGIVHDATQRGIALSMSTLHALYSGTNGRNSFPKPRTLQALVELLPATPLEVLLAAGASVGMSVSPPDSAIVRGMPAGAETLDDEPLAVRGVHSLVAAMVEMRRRSDAKP